MNETEDIGAEHGSAIAGATRRGFLLLGLSLLAGCAKKTTRAMLPNPPWPSLDTPALEKPPGSWPDYEPPAPEALPQLPGWRGRVLARSKWARGGPIPRRMNRMSPIRYITGEVLKPFNDVVAWWGVDKNQGIASDINPSLSPSLTHLLGKRHRQIVDQLIGDDHATDRRRHLLRGIDVCREDFSRCR